MSFRGTVYFRSDTSIECKARAGVTGIEAKKRKKRKNQRANIKQYETESK